MIHDKLVATDLAALAADSRRHPRSLDDMLRAIELRVRPASPELVLVRLASAFGHRVARAAAGAMALACTLALLGPLVVRRLVDREPVGWGRWSDLVDHGSLWLGIWSALLVVGSYALAAALAQRYLARRLGADAAPGTVEVVGRLARSVEGPSLALWIAGLSSLATLFGVVTFVLGNIPWGSLWYRGGPVSAQFDDRLRDLVVIVAAVVVAGIVLGRQYARGAGWARALDRRRALVLGVGLAIALDLLALAIDVKVDVGSYTWAEAPAPSSALRTVLSVLGGIAMLLAVASTALWQHSRDGARTQLDGAAPADPRLAALAALFAQRTARALAGTAAALCTIGLLAISYTSFGRSWAHRIVDHVDLHRPWQLDLFGAEVPLLAGIALAAVATHTLGARLATAWFEHRLARAVAAAREPVPFARQLVQRTDGWSAGLGIAGAAVAAVFGVVAVTIGPDFTLFVRSHGPRVQGVVGHALHDATATAALTFGVAVAIGHACARDACWLRCLEHRALLAMGVALVAAAACVGLYIDFGVTDISSLASPSRRLQSALAGLLTAGVLMLVVAHTLRRRRRERAL